MAKSQVPSWEEIINMTPTEERETWDTEDSQSTAEHQFDDVIIEDEVMIQTITEEEELEHQVAGELLTPGKVAGGNESKQYPTSPAGEVQL